MKGGNWVPISKFLAKHLPKDRPYSRIEAAFSLQMDYDSGNRVTVTGYSHLWRWSVGKVYRFLKEMNVQIKYPEDTRKNQNQKGMIMNMKPEGKRNESGMIRLIDSKRLENVTERKRKENGRKTEGSQTTTKDPNTNPNISLCPQQQIVDLYHERLPELPKIRFWSEERQATLRARWNQALSNNNGLKSNCVEWWAGYFDYIRTSDFLMGRVDPLPGKKRFIANLEWLVKKQPFINILEGKYHR